MLFERRKYLNELIAGRGNGLVKIVTGVRRCGKSFLLFNIWHNWLWGHGGEDGHIIEILRKVVIVGDDIHRKEDDFGVLTIGLLDFLTDKNLLEQG